MTLPYHGFPDFQSALNVADSQVFTGTQVMASGTTLSPTPVDMRLYSSYQVTMRTIIGGLATNWNSVQLTLSWADDAVGTNVVWREEYVVHPQAIGGSAFDVPVEELYVQGPVKGPYLIPTIRNNGPDSLTLNASFLGNSRTLPGNSATEMQPSGIGASRTTDLQLLDQVQTIAAAAIVTTPLRISPGPVSIVAVTVTQPFNFTFTTADGRIIDQLVVAANATQRQIMHWPRKSVRVAIANTGAGIGTYACRIVSTRDLI